MNLSRKIGPLPLWAWLGLGAVAGYILLRRLGSSSPSGQQQVVVRQATPDTNMGLTPSAGAPTDNGQLSSDLLSTLGQQNANLVQAITSRDQAASSQTAAGAVDTSAATLQIQDAAASAVAQVQAAAAQMTALLTSTATAPVDTSTAAQVSPQPGGSNAPAFTFVFPGITTATHTAPPKGKTPAGKVKTGAKTKSSPATKYFTYKRQVPLRSGQTVHFASGKGYYAA